LLPACPNNEPTTYVVGLEAIAVEQVISAKQVFKRFILKKGCCILKDEQNKRAL
jgi:hypothetical protein